jgi:hypothetical protein
MAHVRTPPPLVVRPQEPNRQWRDWLLLALIWLVSMIVVATAVWLWRERAPIAGGEQLKAALDQNASLQQRIAVLERAEQVARTANADLQREIRERQEEIASVRADLAFYSRLTSVGVKRDGLAVQKFQLEAVANAPRSYNFTITLTQNLKAGQTSKGRVRLSVSGMRADQLATLDWKDLAQNQDVEGLTFSFKYFQQIRGTLLLPEGFAPNGIHVEADGGAELGKATGDFGWTDALANRGNSNAG